MNVFRVSRTDASTLREAIARAHNTLKVVEKELTGKSFLVGSEPTVADVAGYTYVAHSPEGNVSLAD